MCLNWNESDYIEVFNEVGPTMEENPVCQYYHVASLGGLPATQIASIFWWSSTGRFIVPLGSFSPADVRGDAF